MKIVLFLLYCLIVLVNLVYGIYCVSRQKGYTIRFGRFGLLTLENILAMSLLLWMMITAVSANNIPDYATYQNVFESGRHVYEIGYESVADAAQRIGISFFGFRAFLLVVSYLLIWRGISRLSFNKNILMALYAIFPYTYDVIQIRHFVACALSLFALHYLMQKSRGGKIKFIITILFASSFHIIAIIYLLFLFTGQQSIRKKWRRQFLALIFVLSLSAAVIMKMNSGLELIVNNLLNSASNQRIAYYVTDKMRWGFLLFWAMQGIYLAVAYGNRAEIIISGQNVSKEFEIVNQLLWMQVVLSCTLPLCIVNVNFYRIFRGMSIINYAQFPFLLEKKNSSRKTLLLAMFIFAFTLNAYVNYSGQIDSVFLSFFR